MIDEKLKYDEGLLDSYQGKWMNLYFLKTILPFISLNLSISICIFVLSPLISYISSLPALILPVCLSCILTDHHTSW